MDRQSAQQHSVEMSLKFLATLDAMTLTQLPLKGRFIISFILFSLQVKICSRPTTLLSHPKDLAIIYLLEL